MIIVLIVFYSQRQEDFERVVSRKKKLLLDN